MKNDDIEKQTKTKGEKMQNKANIKAKRRGFTLIEVILAIVVVAVIMGIVIPKIMSNSDKAQIKQVISSDVRSIISAAADWKRTDQTTSDGTYKNISAELLDSRLPSNIQVDADNKYIKSSGFHGGCLFTLVKDADDGHNFKMGMDCSDAAKKLNWSSKLIAYAKQAFIDTVKTISPDSNKEDGDTEVSSGGQTVKCNDNESICATNISQ